MIRVVLADDHELVRAGLKMLLEAEDDIEVVGEAGDGRAAVRQATERSADVVVMDLRMPVVDGIEASRILAAHEVADPNRLVRVLVLTTFADERMVHDALRAGASGYLLKQSAPADLVKAIHHVAQGDSWLDPRITGVVINALTTSAVPGGQNVTILQALTPREIEVLTLMAAGMSNSDICKRLVISEATTKTHVARVVMKTGSRDRTQAVVLAYRSGLVRPDGTPSPPPT